MGGRSISINEITPSGVPVQWWEGKGGASLSLDLYADGQNVQFPFEITPNKNSKLLVIAHFYHGNVNTTTELKSKYMSVFDPSFELSWNVDFDTGESKLFTQSMFPQFYPGNRTTDFNNGFEWSCSDAFASLNERLRTFFR
jgi:hypothetical protein